MKRFPLYALLVLAFATVLGAVWYVKSSKPLAAQATAAQRPTPVPALAQATPVPTAALPIATKPAPALASALPAGVPRTLFAPPTAVQGKALPARSAKYVQVSTAGDASVGRIAKLDRASMPELSTLKVGDTVRMPLFDKQIAKGVVNLVVQEGGITRVVGKLAEGDAGSFFMNSGPFGVSGMVQDKRQRKAFQISSERDGTTQLTERDLGDVICLPIPRDDEEPMARAGAAEGPLAAVPVLNSRPSALCQIYLDFDGETVEGTLWNENGRPIVAPPHDLSASTITNIFNRVKEDFWPFNINVTTERSKYDAAPVNKRMHVIITPNDEVARGAGGVAYLDSFLDRRFNLSPGKTLPCWVFNSREIGITEAISHEVGHTFNLDHDGRSNGEEYYRGHGTGATSWCPIMGAGYDANVTQWSRGEYRLANQKEDDLQFISSRIGIAIGGGTSGYMPDDAGNSISAAVPLAADAETRSVNEAGTIERTADVDCYSFTTNGGSVTLAARGSVIGSNLDISMELLDSMGEVIVANNPPQLLTASLTATVPEGVYIVRVTSSGAGDVLNTGYSNYGSLGQYLITGTINGLTNRPLITSGGTATGKAGVSFAYRITASGSPTSYEVSGRLPEGLALNSATWEISGSPQEWGTFTITVTARNSFGFGSRVLTITIAPPFLTLGQALDFQSVDWSSPGPVAWFAQTAVKSPGESDAVQAGQIGDNGTSSFGATVTGPATLKFRWKVSSQAGADFLAFQINGSDAAGVAPISGVVDWTEVSVEIPAGQNQLSWVYRKDGAEAQELDTAYVDFVRFESVSAPDITSSTTASGIVGNAFTYRITATNLPGSFGLVGDLPPGLRLNPESGFITGVPSVAATTSFEVSASNNVGSDTQGVTITITANSITTGQALNNTSIAWTTAGDAPWFTQTVETTDGISALQAGRIGNGQQSYVEGRVPGNDGSDRTLNFRWKADSDLEDELQLLVNGVKRLSISGATEWLNPSVDVKTGDLLRWVYTKSLQGAAGEDTAYLDRIVVTTQKVPIINSPSQVTELKNGNFSYQITAVNQPTSFSAENLPAGLVLDPSTGLISGQPLQAGTFDNVILGATNAAGTGRLVLKIIILPSIAEAVDQPERVFTTRGVPWITQVAVTVDNQDAVQSGPTPDRGESTFETIVEGPTKVKFQWRVSSERGKDFLQFKVDGSLKRAITGDLVRWEGFEAEIPAGTHTLSWSYVKDSSASAFQDRGWVDTIVFSNAEVLPRITSPLKVTAYVGRAFRYDIDSSNKPATYTVEGLPSPLTVSNNVISGMAPEEGRYLVTLNSGNAAGSTSSVLELTVIPELPGADNRANATQIGGAAVRMFGTNVFASAEAGEVKHAGRDPRASVWYSWRAPMTGTVSITTLGTNFDTVLSVYHQRRPTAAGAAQPEMVYENDDAPRTSTSAVRLAVKAGETCLIAVDGVEGATGNVVLNINYVGTSIYQGLLEDENDAADPGAVTLNLTEKLSFTGSIRVAGKKISVKGSFTGEDFSGQVSTGRATPPAQLTLHVALAAGAQEVTGALELNGVRYLVNAKLAMRKEDVPPTLPGPFTFLIEPNLSGSEAPEGTGFGTASIDKKGKFLAIGTLGDGTKFSFSQQLALDKSAAVFLTPYPRGGVFAGNLFVDSGNAFAPLESLLVWRRTANATSKTFPEGFSSARKLKGYRHDPKRLPMLQLSRPSENVSVVFTKGDLTTEKPVDLTVTILADGKMAVVPGFKLTLSKTGLFTGSLTIPGVAKPRAFSGAVVNGREFVPVPGTNTVVERTVSRGGGQFLGVKETGRVELIPVPAVQPPPPEG